MRRAAGAWGVGLIVLAVAVALTSSSPSSEPRPTVGPAGSRGPGTGQTTPAPLPARSFTLAQPEVAAFNTPPLLPVEARDGAQALLNQYLERAVLAPLESGRTGDLTPLFTAPALERVKGPDRAALVDEGVVGAADVVLDSATAQLTALVGPGGVHMMVAGIHVVVRVRVNGAPMVVQRSGELSLVVEGAAWKIASYDVRVDRDLPR